MSGEEQVFHSADSIVQEAGANDKTTDLVNTFPIEFLCSLTASGLPPGELHLKHGCPLILLQNLSPTQGLCNADDPHPHINEGLGGQNYQWQTPGKD